MDWVQVKAKLWDVVQKYRYGALIFLAGVILLTLPSGKETQISDLPTKEENYAESRDLQAELENLLSRLEGAGKVRVLLTETCGEEITYQTDEDIKSGEGTKDIRRETILITNKDRSQEGLIQRVDSPVYQGAVILCQGAGSAAVRLAIVEAVKSATGLPANRITVLKMK